MKNTIFFGNGLNRAYNLLPDWNDLLKMIASEDIPSQNKIPYTLQYESFLMEKPHLSFDAITNGGEILCNGGDLIGLEKHTEEDIKANMCKRLQSTDNVDIYRRLAELNVENYITTNYDYNLRDTYNKYETFSILNQSTEKIYSIRRKMDILKDQNLLTSIWHIHGEIDKPKTLMLGLDHYCGYISKINSFIKGSGDYQNITKIVERIKDNKCTAEESWIDLFFTTDIHIIGFGLDYCETDIWYILNRRKRVFRENLDFKSNKIFYYGDLRKKKDMIYLLEKFDIEYIQMKVVKKKYDLQLESIMTKLEQTIGKRK